MTQKVFGYRPAAQGTGQVSMPFEQAKAMADERRKEQFELNQKRFFGEDNFSNSQYGTAKGQFFGC